MLRVTVLGGGSWGTAVAALTCRNAEVRLWARNKETVKEINSKHTNTKYLPDAKLPPSLKAFDSIKKALKNTDVLVMGIPSSSFREVLEEAREYIRPWVPVVSLTKGLERGTDLRMTEVVEKVLPGHPVGVLTGPNLAREIMAGQAAASVLAMNDEIVVNRLQQTFHNGLFRVYTNSDVVGCELGGILKNIIAIAVGMGIGLGAGDNTRSAVITRGLAEISRLGMAMGGKPETFAGLTGMGDLIATCVSPQSRNHTVGVRLGQGETLDEIIEDMHMVAEGVKSAPMVMRLAEKYDVDMPIARDVYQVITGESTPQGAFRGLLRTTVGAESEPG